MMTTSILMTHGDLFLFNSCLYPPPPPPSKFVERKFGLVAPPVPHRVRCWDRGLSIGVSALGIDNCGKGTIKRLQLSFT